MPKLYKSAVAEILAAVNGGRHVTVQDIVRITGMCERVAREKLYKLQRMGELSRTKRQVGRHWVMYFAQPGVYVPEPPPPKDGKPPVWARSVFDYGARP